MKHRIQHMRNLALKQLGIPGGKTPVSTLWKFTEENLMSFTIKYNEIISRPHVCLLRMFSFVVWYRDDIVSTS